VRFSLDTGDASSIFDVDASVVATDDRREEVIDMAAKKKAKKATKKATKKAKK